MLVSALKHRKLVNAITSNQELEIKEFRLTEEEWGLVENLKNVLKVCLSFLSFDHLAPLITVDGLVQVFKRLTVAFSSDRVPTIADVIPAYDAMDAVLEADAANTKYPDSIRVALALARRTLNRYYARTDLSDIYRVAMCTSIVYFYFFLPVDTGYCTNSAM